jgi:hypothetical protein
LAGNVVRRLPIPRSLLTDRISLEASTKVADGQGGFTYGFTTLATHLRALVLDSSPPSGSLGGELLSLGALAQHVTHRIWLRDDVVGLDARSRVKNEANGKHYLIHDVSRFGGNVLIQAEEVR